MSNGREIIEETNKIIVGVSNELGDLKGSYLDEAFHQFEGTIGSCLKWAKLCRGKVWLRTTEGTDLAQGCLGAANRMKAELGNPLIAIDAARDLSNQLEALARLLATKAQIIT